MCKECSVAKNGSFVWRSISVLCDWCMNDILPPIPDFFPPQLAKTLLVGDWSSCVILGTAYAVPPGTLLKLFWIFSFTSPFCFCHHIVLVSPCFLQKAICVPFCELFPSWLSVISEREPQFLFQTSLVPENQKAVNFFGFLFTYRALYLYSVTFLLFLFQKCCLALLIKIKWFGETFTNRQATVNLLVKWTLDSEGSLLQSLSFFLGLSLLSSFPVTCIM